MLSLKGHKISEVVANIYIHCIRGYFGFVKTLVDFSTVNFFFLNLIE